LDDDDSFLVFGFWLLFVVAFVSATRWKRKEKKRKEKKVGFQQKLFAVKTLVDNMTHLFFIQPISR